VRWHIALRPGKRRALPDTESGRLCERIEKLKASVRAKVEHPFHIVKNMFGHKKARYRRLAKNTSQLMTLLGLANLLIAKRRLFALHAQGASRKGRKWKTPRHEAPNCTKPGPDRARCRLHHCRG
jgi:transposase, IS5 family